MTTAVIPEFLKDHNVELCMMQLVMHNAQFKDAHKSKSDFIAWLEEYVRCIEDTLTAVRNSSVKV